MLRQTLRAFVALAALAPAAASAAPPVEVGSRVEPFVDEFLIDRLAGSARLELRRPEPGEVVLTADRPWEGNTSAYYTVFRDGDRFRMYYRGAHYDPAAKKATHPEVTCYAESDDGIHWRKPELGLFEFDGSKANNIVWAGPESHNFTPFRDDNPDCPREARYKALAGVNGGLFPFRSADGVRWEKMAGKPVITNGAFDSQNLGFWDAHARTYREYHRGYRGVRDILTGTSPDFLRWAEPAYITITGAPREHLYTNAVLPYFRAPHILIGFPTRFLPKTEQTEPTFMASRDGTNFRRFAEPVIPTTAPADRDGNRSNYMAWGLVTLPGRDRELSVYAKEAYYKGPGSRVRRFTYRLDGFAALHADASGGEVTTRPLTFRGKSLVLNARTGAGGSVRVELQGEDGTPLPGFALSDGPGFSGDDTARAIAWGPKADLPSFEGRPVRLRFVLKDADLYSFRFE